MCSSINCHKIENDAIERPNALKLLELVSSKSCHSFRHMTEQSTMTAFFKLGRISSDAVG